MYANQVSDPVKGKVSGKLVQNTIAHQEQNTRKMQTSLEKRQPHKWFLYTSSSNKGKSVIEDLKSSSTKQGIKVLNVRYEMAFDAKQTADKITVLQAISYN